MSVPEATRTKTKILGSYVHFLSKIANKPLGNLLAVFVEIFAVFAGDYFPVEFYVVFGEDDGRSGWGRVVKNREPVKLLGLTV